MLARLQQLFSDKAWQHGERPWYGSLGLSAMLHVVLVAVLAGIWLSPYASENITAVETAIAPSTEIGPEPFISDSDTPRGNSSDMPEETAEGGGKRSPVKLANDDQVSFNAQAPVLQSSASPVASGDALAGIDPLAVVGELSGGGGSKGDGGSGHGEGNGNGDGAGSGFFGSGSTAQSVVFVLDASASMNERHGSEAKTRFGKLKLELLHSVSRMHKDLSFFIFFFNDGPIPMPADTLQPATPELQTKYMEWMAGVRAQGSTDPRLALTAALELKPDAIFFLTDGVFEPKVRRDLRKLRQNQTVIHTIGFGSLKAENDLKAIAKANRGTYHFVP